MALEYTEFEWIDEITYTVIGQQYGFYECVGHCCPANTLLLTYDEILKEGKINHF